MELNYHVNQVVKFMNNAGQETPDTVATPSPEQRILRAKLILEEAFELINKGLGVNVYSSDVSVAPLTVGQLDYQIVSDPDIVEAMDGAADLFWVGVAGVSIIFGCELEPVLEEVNKSNASKFIDGYRREDGKWVKGPSYKPAEIKAVIHDRVPF